MFYCFFLFIFFHLTCMLKKSQSWGLSSSLEDKTELHSPPTSLPSWRIIHWSVFEQRIGPNSPSISLRNAPKPEMFCLPDHSLRRKLRVHFFINVKIIRTKIKSELRLVDIWSFVLWINGKLFHSNMADRTIFYCILQQKTNPQKAFNAMSLLLTKKRKSFLCTETQCRFMKGPAAGPGRAELNLCQFSSWRNGNDRRGGGF